MKHNSPLIKILEIVANMLIVSFFWTLCSIPIVTIIPASSALYHTMNKKIFDGRGNGVVKDFFNSFKLNFVQGFKVNIICIIAVGFIVIGLNTAFQIYTLNIFGLLYLILSFLITFVFAIMLVFLPPVISKFYLKVIDYIKLSVFLSFQNIFLSILNVLLLVLFVFIVRIIPITIVITPALYVGLVSGSIEKRMQKFIYDNNLNEEVLSEEKSLETTNDVSFYDIDKNLSKSRKSK